MGSKMWMMRESITCFEVSAGDVVEVKEKVVHGEEDDGAGSFVIGEPFIQGFGGF